MVPLGLDIAVGLTGLMLLQAVSCPETTSDSRSFVFTDYSSIFSIFSVITPPSSPSSPVADDSAHAPTHHTTYNQLYRLEVRSKLAGSLTLRV